MNQNKLYKLLKQTPHGYNNLDKFKSELQDYVRIKISLPNEGFGELVSRARDATFQHGIFMPFNNIMFDIDGLEITNHKYEVSSEPFVLLISNNKVRTENWDFMFSVLQDFQFEDGSVFSRTHVGYIDEDRGIHATPVVDLAVATTGCTCYTMNPLSIKPLFKQIMDRTPGMPYEVGVVSMRCDSKKPICKGMINTSNQMFNIALAILYMINSENNTLTKIGTDSNTIKDMPHYILTPSLRYDEYNAPTDSLENYPESFDADITTDGQEDFII